MLDDFDRLNDDYDYEERCRQCGCIGMVEEELLPCGFCVAGVPSGRVLYNCTGCTNQWKIGHSRFAHGRRIVCDACLNTEVGACVACGNTLIGAVAHPIFPHVACDACYAIEDSIWCPKCDRQFLHGGYLRFAFWGDPPGFHAAALVTHYRHEHVRSYDAAWSNHRYARRIPGYDRELMRYDVNNRAKRQLIRAIKTHVAEGTYPYTLPYNAMELVRAFSRLRENDDATNKLIVATIDKLEQPPPITSARRRASARRTTK